MIKLNEQYSINNGQGSIVFSEGNNGTVNALYTISGNKSEGKINGTEYGFIIAGSLRIVGNGLILGSDVYGENKDTKVLPEDLDITFIDVNPEEEQRNIDIQVHFN
jgi:hypothetical protein